MTVAEQPSTSDVQRGVQYVGNIDFDWHYNKPVGELTFTVAADRWLAYPGSVCEVVGEGQDPRIGRWLNWQFRQPLDSDEMEITLQRPAPAKPEPSATIKTTTLDSPDTGNGKVAMPVKTNLATDTNGFSGYHDGIDLICAPNAPLHAICDAEVIDVRSSGWWGLNPTGDVTKGDGIIQLKALESVGPIKKGMHFGYGHAEHAVVKTGQQVKAGQVIGKAGFANAWHVHFMVNTGGTASGTGNRDPKPILTWVKQAGG
jgi:murein DD-endopeptidase MepM/ murein hydrolase activator NlpD